MHMYYSYGIDEMDDINIKDIEEMSLYNWDRYGQLKPKQKDKAQESDAFHIMRKLKVDR